MQICIVAAITLCFIVQDLQKLPAFATSQTPATVVALLCLGTAIVALSAVHVVFQTRRETSQAARSSNRRLDIRTTMHTTVWFCMVLFTVCISGWPQYCWDWCSVPSLARVLAVAPMVIWLILSWSILYSAESRLDPSLTPSRRYGFVWHRIRLFLAIPLLVILAVVVSQDLFDALVNTLGMGATSEGASPGPFLHVLQGLRLLPLAALILFFPVLLRSTWITQPLNDGVLRDRLRLLSNEHQVTFRDILRWDTQQRMRNAAVSGLIRWTRCALLTDRLLRDLSQGQVECVFLHEIAHVKLRHQLKLATMGILWIASTVWLLLQPEWDASPAGWNTSPFGLLATGIGAISIVAGINWIGRLSQLHELEADLWVVRSTKKSAEEYMQSVAALSPDKNQTTWSHPALRIRINALTDPSRAWLEVQRKLRRLQCFAAALMVTQLLIAAMS